MEVQQTAVESSQRAVNVALNEYVRGTVDYTTVVTAQTTELSNAQTALGIQEQRLVASVGLIEALGRGEMIHTSKCLPHPTRTNNLIYETKYSFLRSCFQHDMVGVLHAT